jgi:hypothetical protein
MTDVWVNYLFSYQNAIGNLYSAVKTARQQQQTGYTFTYRYTSIQNPGNNKVYDAGTLWTFYWVSFNMQGFGQFAQNVISTSQVTLNNGTVLSLDPIDVEVLILLAMMTPLGNLFQATKFAQQYVAEGKCYCFPAAGLADFSGSVFPTIVYGGRELINLGNRYVGSNYGYNTTL